MIKIKYVAINVDTGEQQLESDSLASLLIFVNKINSRAKREGLKIYKKKVTVEMEEF